MLENNMETHFIGMYNYFFTIVDVNYRVWCWQIPKKEHHQPTRVTKVTQGLTNHIWPAFWATFTVI